MSTLNFFDTITASAGRKIRLTYKSRSSGLQSVFLGRLQSMEPVEDAHGVGLRFKLRMGKFTGKNFHGDWEESDAITEINLGPFKTISSIKSHLGVTDPENGETASHGTTHNMHAWAAESPALQLLVEILG